MIKRNVTEKVCNCELVLIENLSCKGYRRASLIRFTNFFFIDAFNTLHS